MYYIPNHTYTGRFVYSINKWYIYIFAFCHTADDDDVTDLLFAFADAKLYPCQTQFESRSDIYIISVYVDCGFLCM